MTASQEFNDLFFEMDKDNSGTIDKLELATFLDKLFYQHWQGNQVKIVENES